MLLPGEKTSIPTKLSRLLSKLCFTLANELSDLNILQAAIDTAKTDL